MQYVDRPRTPFLFGLIVLVALARVTCLAAKEPADRGDHDPKRPLVIAHRGASGFRPEHTLEAYRLAIKQGADFIEPDLVATRDGVLIARHENELSGTTDVAQRPEYSERKTTKQIDGVAMTGWFSEDFTLAEIKTLRARERIPDVRPANAAFDGQFQIPTLMEIIDLVKGIGEESNREIGLYMETKHPTYFAKAGTSLNGEPINISLGDLLIETLIAGDFTEPNRIFIQSFEFENLIELQREIMPAAGVDLPLVQLFGDVTDAFVQPESSFSRPYDVHFNALQGVKLEEIYGGLVDLAEGGLTPTTGYGDLLTPAVLEFLSVTYAEGIGPWKNSFLLRDSIDDAADGNGDGVAEIRSKLTGEVEPFVRCALLLGLDVHPYTLRAEERFLTLTADRRPQTITDEVLQLLELGVTGFFIDHPDAGVLGRDRFLDQRDGGREQDDAPDKD